MVRAMSAEPRFSLLSTPLESGFALEARADEVVLSRGAFYEALRDQAALRRALVRAILDTGLPAVAWETAPLSRERRDAPMQQLVLPHPALVRAEPDASSFSEHIANGAGTQGVRSFQNFGHDATLVVPCVASPGARFAHLVSFLRTASPEQSDALFARVGAIACQHLADSDAPLWVSTAGMAVPWVHVRLDSRPKYYRTESLRARSA